MWYLVTRIVGQTTGESSQLSAKNPFAVALGKLGVSKGGKARTAMLPGRERAAIVKKAATARWPKKQDAAVMALVCIGSPRPQL
jgi:hypothetical protein